jgi:hypothetical protein
MAERITKTVTCDLCGETCTGPRYHINRVVPHIESGEVSTFFISRDSRETDVCEKCGDDGLGLASVGSLRP